MLINNEKLFIRTRTILKPTGFKDLKIEQMILKSGDCFPFPPSVLTHSCRRLISFQSDLLTFAASQETEVGVNPVQVEIGEFDEAIELEDDFAESERAHTHVTPHTRPRFAAGV